jgi:acyl-CoA synthetase (AMP-forming)/AMP-acid ligase II/acyl carrier protein
MLSAQADEQSTDIIYRYLADGETVTRTLSFAELDLHARAIAAKLQSVSDPGDRALIMTSDSIDFILAFMACQHARVIAVPAYPPFPLQSELRIATLRAIVDDCGARVVIGSPVQLRQAIHDTVGDLATLPWIEIDEVPIQAALDFRAVEVASEHVSFLQYTSGSTSLPKGVVITHAAVMQNEKLISASFGDPQGSDTGVGWLPLYHDMGLIGYVLQTLYAGGETVLMPPLAFIQRPVRWLQAISNYKAGYSGGPNFAYELCVRRIAPEERVGLDLSSWRVAFNGAEPVRGATLDAFAEAFGPCGFDRHAWYPCYGLAENTLIATGPQPGAGARRLSVQADALGEGRLEPGDGHDLVGSGRPTMHRRLEIVDPRTRRQLEPGTIGEIWLAGPDVARGYWGDAQRSHEAFEATLADGTSGLFLRSGDLGAMYDGELFVTGRLKDLIIIDGRNHYPQDIEATAESSHIALRHGCSAAFAHGHSGAEQVILVAELKAGADADPEEVARAVRAAIASRHGLALGELMLVGAQSVPKTSSGKLQRSACHAAWAEGRLVPVKGPPKRRLPDLDEVVDWLVEQLAAALGVDTDSISLDAPFVDLGLSSVQAVELSDELQRWTGLTLPPTLIFDYPTINAAAEYIANEAPDAALTR